MREIAEIELAIQGGTEKIETLGTLSTTHFWYARVLSTFRRTRESRRVYEGDGSHRGIEERKVGKGGGSVTCAALV